MRIGTYGYRDFVHNGMLCSCVTCKYFECSTEEEPCRSCFQRISTDPFPTRLGEAYEADSASKRTPPRVHELKLLPQYFVNQKSFELRKDDRDFEEGDLLLLREYDEYTERYTGRFAVKKITYVLRGCPQYGLVSGYCILAVAPFSVM